MVILFKFLDKKYYSNERIVVKDGKVQSHRLQRHVIITGLY